MRQFLARWGTTLIYWSFAVTAITGVMLFLRARLGPTEQLHIWIGFLMLLAFVTHVARNWKAFLTYFKKPPVYVALAVTVVISALFAWPVMSGGTEGGPAGAQGGPRAAFAVVEAVADAPIETIAPLAHTDTAGLIARLGEIGVTATDGTQTLASAAEAAGKEPAQVLGQLLAVDQGGAGPG